MNNVNYDEVTYTKKKKKKTTSQIRTLVEYLVLAPNCDLGLFLTFDKLL